MVATRYSSVIALLLLLTSTGAFAVDLTNDDQVPRQVTIRLNDSARTIKLEAGESRQSMCPKGCTLTLAGGGRLILMGTETVLIRDGRLLLVR